MEITVGMGATQYVGSDRYPYTIVGVASQRKVVVQADNFCRVDSNGHSEDQEYVFTLVPSARKITLTKRKNGTWVRQGSPMTRCSEWQFGFRSCFQDPHF